MIKREREEERRQAIGRMIKEISEVVERCTSDEMLLSPKWENGTERQEDYQTLKYPRSGMSPVLNLDVKNDYGESDDRET